MWSSRHEQAHTLPPDKLTLPRTRAQQHTRAHSHVCTCASIAVTGRLNSGKYNFFVFHTEVLFFVFHTALKSHYDFNIYKPIILNVFVVSPPV